MVQGTFQGVSTRLKELASRGSSHSICWYNEYLRLKPTAEDNGLQGTKEYLTPTTKHFSEKLFLK